MTLWFDVYFNDVLSCRFLNKDLAVQFIKFYQDTVAFEVASIKEVYA